MKKQGSLPAILLMITILTGCIGAGKTSQIIDHGPQNFPGLIGIDLLGKQRQIPKTFAGKKNLIMIGFERAHQTPINSWIEVAQAIAAEKPDFHFYEMPTIDGLNSMWRLWINNGMRSGIADQAARERTITVYTDREKLTQLLDMKMDQIYVMLLNQEGQILWRAQGPTTPEKIAGLKTALK